MHGPRVLTVTWVMYKNRSSIELQGVGREARNFNIANCTPRATRAARKISENFLWETVSQPTEKKTACDKKRCEQNTIVLRQLAYQRLG